VQLSKLIKVLQKEFDRHGDAIVMIDGFIEFGDITTQFYSNYEDNTGDDIGPAINIT